MRRNLTWRLSSAVLERINEIRLIRSGLTYPPLHLTLEEQRCIKCNNYLRKRG